jgi:hypothetical protein
MITFRTAATPGRVFWCPDLARPVDLTYVKAAMGRINA